MTIASSKQFSGCYAPVHRGETYRKDLASGARCIVAIVAGAEVVIPTRANRVVSRSIDAEVYRRRNVIERWFGRLKQFRRIATRYDKTQSSYRGFVALSASQIALSGWRA